MAGLLVAGVAVAGVAVAEVAAAEVAAAEAAAAEVVAAEVAAAEVVLGSGWVVSVASGTSILLICDSCAPRSRALGIWTDPTTASFDLPPKKASFKGKKREMLMTGARGAILAKAVLFIPQGTGSTYPF